MKNILLCLLSLSLFLSAAAELPKSLDELKARHADQGKTPEGALKLWFDAVLVSTDPANGETGPAMIGYLTVPYKDQQHWYRLSTARTFVERIQQKPYIFKSYAKGATPANGYAMDPNDYQLDITSSKQDDHGRGWAIAVKSGGADSARKVYLRQSTSTGLYYVDTFNSLFVDVRSPVDPNQETFK